MNTIAEGVRLAMVINKISDTETIVEAILTCTNAEPNETRSRIRFFSDEPFELQYSEGTDNINTDYKGLDGRSWTPLFHSVMENKGALIGFKENDGKIPGDFNNRVKVSIEVKVVKM